MNTSGLNMFSYDEPVNTLLQEPTRPARHSMSAPPHSFPHPQRHVRAAAPPTQDPGVVSPVFFGYEVHAPATPHAAQHTHPTRFQQQQQHGHLGHQPHRRAMPASMGFSAPPMRHDTHDMQPPRNMSMSYYQAFQNEARLDSIDAGLFSNYDMHADAQSGARAMYMTDGHGNESIVEQEYSTNPAYRLYKS